MITFILTTIALAILMLCLLTNMLVMYVSYREIEREKQLGVGENPGLKNEFTQSATLTTIFGILLAITLGGFIKLL